MSSAEQFIVEEPGACRFFAAEKVIVTVKTSLAELYVAHIMFQRRDGSIFVQAPEFRHTDGLLSNVSLESDGSFPETIDMRKGGKTVSHLAKYSHHPDGRVQFSQHDKIITEVLHPSAFPLNGPIGKVFFLNAAFPTSGFLPVDRRRAAKKGYLVLNFDMSDRIPEAIQLRGEWRRKADVPLWTTGAALLGPKVETEHRVTGARSGAFLLGQPEDFPLTDHVLALFCNHVPLPSGADGPSMIFLGGADSDEVPEPGMTAAPSDCLAWFYPIPNREELETLLGSLDYVPGEALAAEDLEAEETEEAEAAKEESPPNDS